MVELLDGGLDNDDGNQKNLYCLLNEAFKVLDTVLNQVWLSVISQLQQNFL